MASIKDYLDDDTKQQLVQYMQQKDNSNQQNQDMVARLQPKSLDEMKNSEDPQDKMIYGLATGGAMGSLGEAPEALQAAAPEAGAVMSDIKASLGNGAQSVYNQAKQKASDLAEQLGYWHPDAQVAQKQANKIKDVYGL